MNSSTDHLICGGLRLGLWAHVAHVLKKISISIIEKIGMILQKQKLEHGNKNIRIFF